NSTLARNADYPILIHSFADQLVAVQTYVGTVVTLLLLGATIAGDSESRWEEDIAALTRALSSFIPDCVERSTGWREFLNGAGAIYLLGRGPSLGSVCEGTLLFHEAAKAPASAMSAAHFRHGPVEVVSGAFRAIVFATQGATRDLDVALASDIVGMGGHVRVIGAGEIEAKLRFCQWPDGIPEALTPVVEIIPVQVAALCLAQWRGITPGDFRFAPEVTLTESGFTPIPKGRA
ncbi:MAG: SIS domain-containing protein, partial [Bryobacteraceae bacterium]